MAPTTGPAKGGVEIVLVADGMPITAEALCTFEFDAPDVVVPATRLSHVSFMCTQVELPEMGVQNIAHSARVWLTPSHSAYPKPSQGSALFTFYEPPIIVSVSPSSGSCHGGTAVRIRGYRLGAVQGVAPYCKFGNLYAVANVINDTLVECASPVGGAASAAAVGYSIDGVSFVESGVQFQYHPPTTSSPSHRPR